MSRETKTEGEYKGMGQSKQSKQLLTALAQFKKAEQQVKDQATKLEAARTRADNMEKYLVQIGIQQALGEAVESTVTPEQLHAAQTELRTQTAVFAEIQKLYNQALREVEESERGVHISEWNRTADKRTEINSRIEKAVQNLKDELESLDRLDREQRAIGMRLGLQLNTRRFQAQENYIAFNLREYVEPGSTLPKGLRLPINQADRQTRHASAPRAKEMAK